MIDEALRATDSPTSALESGGLAQRAAFGGFFNLLSQIAATGVSLATIVVLGRLLTPPDFGLVALSLATVGLFIRVRDAGLAAATFQRPVVSQEQVSALFWLSAAVSAGLGLLIVLSARPVAAFYRDTRLVAVTATLGLIPLLDGLGAQHESLLKRRLRFRALATSDLVSSAVGSALALVLAARGAGYWALVALEIATSASYTLLVWMTSGWRPGRPARADGVSEMLRFGLQLSAFRVLAHLTASLDTIFVGRFSGSHQAGLYERALKLLTLPFQLVTRPLGGVAIPTLSRLQLHPEQYRRFYRSLVQVGFSLTTPALAFLFVEAERVIVLALGPAWLPCAPLFRILAPAALLGRFNLLTNWVFVSTGRADRQLRWSAFALVPMVVAYAVGARWGAVGVAAAYTTATLALRVPSLYFCFQTAPPRVRDVFDALRLPASASLVAALVLAVAAPRIASIPGGDVGALAVHLVIFLASYSALWLSVREGREALRDLLALVRTARP